MGNLVCAGAMCKCSFGMAPSVLMVTPEKKVVAGMPVANIMDYVPMKNVMPFAMCSSMQNPAVAAATAAAFGVLTPQPCTPVITAPWMTGSPTVMVGTAPALNNTSKLMCLFGGMIEITNAGTMGISVP